MSCYGTYLVREYCNKLSDRVNFRYVGSPHWTQVVGQYINPYLYAYCRGSGCIQFPRLDLIQTINPFKQLSITIEVH